MIRMPTVVYEEALTLNPKIGVKRRLDVLKKKLG